MNIESFIKDYQFKLKSGFFLDSYGGAKQEEQNPFAISSRTFTILNKKSTIHKRVLVESEQTVYLTKKGTVHEKLFFLLDENDKDLTFKKTRDLVLYYDLGIKPNYLESLQDLNERKEFRTRVETQEQDKNKYSYNCPHCDHIHADPEEKYLKPLNEKGFKVCKCSNCQEKFILTVAISSLITYKIQEDE